MVIDSKNSKTSDLVRIHVNREDPTNLKRNDKYIVFSNLSIYYTWKNIKKSNKTIHLSCQDQNEMKKLKCLMNYTLNYHTLHLIFKIILSTWQKT